MERSHRGLEPETPRGLRNARGGWRSGRRCTSTGSWSAGRTLPRSPTPGPAGSWWSCTLWRRCGLSSRRAAKATVYWNLPEREATEPFLTSLFCWARDPQARRGGENAADIQLLDSMYRQSVVKLLGTRDPCYRFRCPAQRSAHRETPTEKRLTHMRDLNRRQGATFAESKHKPRRRNTKPSKKASPLSVSL